ncbi:MAG: hypothetical protein WA532_03250, partial [Candidatus Korobacteraceae bacterium]
TALFWEFFPFMEGASGCAWVLGAQMGEACIEEKTAMQTTGMDESERRTLLEALAAESALRETTERPEIGWGGDVLRRQRTALHGFKVALPFAVLLWMLMAGILWVAAR